MGWTQRIAKQVSCIVHRMLTIYGSEAKEIFQGQRNRKERTH